MKTSAIIQIHTLIFRALERLNYPVIHCGKKMKVKDDQIGVEELLLKIFV